MRRYEIVVIFDASLEESVIREVTDRVTELVRSKGGTPGAIDRWGRRTFAYELRRSHATYREGYYVIIEVASEPEPMAEVDRLLTLSDDVLRHKVIRVDERTGRNASRRSAAPAAEEAAAPESEPVGEPTAG